MIPGANSTIRGSAAGNEKSAVIMLGAHDFPDLHSVAPIPQLASASRKFRDYLLSHRNVLGIEDSFVLDLFDANELAGAQTELIAAFLERFVLDTPGCRMRNVFIHYAGHGLLLGDRHRLCLAVKRSRNKMGSTLNISNLAEIFSDSARYTRKLIILDCCFSAAAAAEMLAEEEGITHFVGAKAVELFRDADGAQSPSRLSRGSALLCAVGKDDVASGESYNGATLFTGALLAAISTPGSDHPRITMQELRERASLCIEEYGSPKLPHMFSLDQTDGDIASKLCVFPTGGIEQQQTPFQDYQPHDSVINAFGASFVRPIIALCVYAIFVGGSLYWTYPYNRVLQNRDPLLSQPSTESMPQSGQEASRQPAVSLPPIQQKSAQLQQIPAQRPEDSVRKEASVQELRQTPSQKSMAPQSNSPGSREEQPARTVAPPQLQTPLEKKEEVFEPRSGNDSLEIWLEQNTTPVPNAGSNQPQSAKEKKPAGTIEPSSARTQLNDSRALDNYLVAIKESNDPAQRRELKIKARTLLVDRMDFGKFTRLGKFPGYRFTGVASFISYSPVTNILRVRYYHKSEAEQKGKSRSWYGEDELDALVDIDVSKLNAVVLGEMSLALGCSSNDVCINAVVTKGKCVNKINPEAGCLVRAITFYADDRTVLKKFGDVIKIFAKIEGRQLR